MLGCSSKVPDFMGCSCKVPDFKQFGILTGFLKVPISNSAPGENEYQEHLLGVKAPVREADDLTTYMCRMS